MAYFPTQKFKPFVFKKKKIINNDEFKIFRFKKLIPQRESSRRGTC